MPVHGLIALLDDIASIAEGVGTMAAAAARKGSAVADDVATLTGVAARKTTGIVTDDMAVTAEQAIGIRREREIPVVLAVARGSMKNKGLYLAPGALLLNAVAPWAILPLLMCGGAFLCFEGVEKVVHKLRPHPEDHVADAAPVDPETFERERVDGAIRTDLVLSAEIIAISLGEVAQAPFLTQAATLYAISVIMTVGVYGLVGVLIKLDDLGELLTRAPGGARERLGRAILVAAPKLLHVISIIGTVAMLMVGGHILLEGIHPLEQAVHHALEAIPGGVRGVVGMAVDVLLGVIAGLLLVGIGATGIPGKLLALIPKKKAS